MLESVLAELGLDEFDRAVECVKGQQSDSSCSVAHKADGHSRKSSSLTTETIRDIADFIDMEECHVKQYVTGVDDLTPLMRNDLMRAYHQEVIDGVQGAFSKCFIKNYMQAKWTSFTPGYKKGHGTRARNRAVANSLHAMFCEEGRAMPEMDADSYTYDSWHCNYTYTFKCGDYVLGVYPKNGALVPILHDGECVIFPQCNKDEIVGYKCKKPHYKDSMDARQYHELLICRFFSKVVRAKIFTDQNDPGNVSATTCAELPRSRKWSDCVDSDES